LNKQIAVSFENESVKVVYVSINRGNIVVKKALTFTDEEFDRFLQTEKDNNFTVVSDFQNFYQDIITLPPAKEKYLRSLVELEIKKKSPELKDFSFYYTVLRDIQREGKQLKEVFVLAVSNEDLNSVVDRFDKHNKSVRYLYPNVLTLSNFVALTNGEPDQPVLNVVDLGITKTIFLMKNHKLHFVRVAQSDGKGIDDIDVENINMTIAYCRQTLRLNPTNVALIGSPGDRQKTNLNLVAAVKSIQYPTNIVAFEETIAEYIVPISAFLHDKELRKNNLLPEYYKSLLFQKMVLKYGIVSFLLFSLVGAGYTGMKVVGISSLKDNITTLRREINEKQPIVSEYETQSKELQQLMPTVNFMNTLNASPDVQKVLIALQCLSMKNVKTQSISINNDKDLLQIQVNGSISSNNFAELQSTYKDLLGEIKKVNNLEISTQKLELKSKSFSLDLRWKT
jgi:hypothetical protein